MVNLCLRFDRSKMKTKSKTLLVMALIVASALAVTMTPIMAAAEETPNVPTPEAFVNRAQSMEQNKQSLRARIQSRLQAAKPEALDIDDLSDDEIEDRLYAAVNAPETDDEDSGANPLWIARAVGSAWPLGDADVDASSVATPVGTMFAATKIKTTEHGTVYDIVWGIVGHDGERVGVKGVAVLCSDGVFVIKMEGDDLALYGIGRIGKAWYGVKLAMKGYMKHDGEMYGFRMRGGAHPVRFNIKRNTQTLGPETLTPSKGVKAKPKRASS